MKKKTDSPGLLEDLHNVMRTRPIQSSSDPVQPVTTGHRSVLLHEAIQYLDIRPDDTVVDATLGGAGHAREIVARLGKKGTFVGFDLDSDAIARATHALKEAACRVELIESNFRNIADALKARGIDSIDKALFDLGWSQYQLDAGRGFSFNTNEPLAMTYAKNPSANALTASVIVNDWKETSIADVIFGWGEERFSRRIARAIVERREQGPISTAHQLAEIVRSAVPGGYRKSRIHPATKTFQALRIAVNDELGSLRDGLHGAWQMLSPGGRIAIISFHSIEDRLVKQQLLSYEKSEGGKRLTKKPIPPGSDELQANPRARSAKLRVIEKSSIREVTA